MAFGDYTNAGSSSGDSVVARLEMAMPQDMDQKLANVSKSVSSLETSMAAFNRFTKEAMEYLGKMPEIAKGMEPLRAFAPPVSSGSGEGGMPLPPPPAAGAPGAPAIPVVPDLPAPVPHTIPGTTGETGGTGATSTPSRAGSTQQVHSGQTIINADQVTISGNAVLAGNHRPTPSTAMPSTVADAHAALVTSQQQSPSSSPPAGGQGAGTPATGQPTVQGEQLPDPSTAQGGRRTGASSAGALLVGAAGYELSEHEKQQAQRAQQGMHQGGPSAKLQSLVDYRAKLASQLGDHPTALLNRMWQEGMTTEGIDHGQASYGVQFGKTKMNVQDFMHSADAQSQAIDELARRTQPQSRHNGSMSQQLISGINIANTMLGAMTPGADPVQTIGQVGQLLDSMVKSGHTQLQIPNVLGGIGSIFGRGQASPPPPAESESTPAEPSSGGGGQFSSMAKQFFANRIGTAAVSRAKESWQQYRARTAPEEVQAPPEEAEEGAETAAKAAKAPRGTAGATETTESGAAAAAEGEGAAGAAGEAAGAAGTAGEVAAGAGEAAAGAGAGGALAAGGIALAPIAAAAAAFVGIQKAGQKYQSIYNEGTVQGGGFSEGLGTEGQIQMMALNPFITTDQSRQIIMGALNEGFQGKQFDNVTSFMEHNLTTMNMSVADSTKLLQKNVVEGGESIQTLGVQLSNLKDAAKEGGASLGDRIAAFTKLSGQGVDAGGGGQMSGIMAAQAGNMFAPTINGAKNPLAEMGSTMVSAAMDSTAVNARIAQMSYPGLAPEAAKEAAIKDGTYNQKVLQVARQVLAQSGSGPNADVMAQRQLSSIFGHNFTMAEIEDLRKQDKEGLVGDGKQRTADQAGNHTKRNVTGLISGAGNALANINRGVQAGVDALNPFNDDSEDMQHEAQFQETESNFSNPALNKIIEAHGIQNTVVYDPQGKAHKVDMNDEAQMKGLESGSWKIATTDDEGQQKDLADDFDKGADELKGDATDLTSLVSSGGAKKGDGGGSGGTIGLTREAAQLITYLPNRSVTSDTNTVNSMSGANGATTNDPNGATAPSTPTGGS